MSANKRSIPLVPPSLPPPDDVVLIEAQAERVVEARALPPPPADPYSDAAVLSRANDPSVAKYFAEIASLLGKENSEVLRIQTAGSDRIPPTVEGLIGYLQGRIKEAKKAQQSTKATASKAPPAQAPAAKIDAAPTDRPLF